MDIPMSNATFPPHITAIAIVICKICLILLLIATVAFTFYRKKITISLNEKGIQIPKENFLFWEKILWYRIDPFSANGLRRIISKSEDHKIIIAADDGAPFEALAKDLKQLLTFYNPLARNYRGSKTSRLWGYFYIILLTGIHITLSFFTNFEVKYLVIFTPALLISILAIFIEKIKKPQLVIPTP